MVSLPSTHDPSVMGVAPWTLPISPVTFAPSSFSVMVNGMEPSGSSTVPSQLAADRVGRGLGLLLGPPPSAPPARHSQRRLITAAVSHTSSSVSTPPDAAAGAGPAAARPQPPAASRLPATPAPTDTRRAPARRPCERTAPAAPALNVPLANQRDQPRHGLAGVHRVEQDPLDLRQHPHGLDHLGRRQRVARAHPVAERGDRLARDAARESPAARPSPAPACGRSAPAPGAGAAR